MLELYQSEACPDCTRVRARLAALGLPFVVRNVPMDRARRARVIEAGGRPDIPLLFDPERGRTTYDADEIVDVLGADDFYDPEETADPDLPELFQREGDAASDEVRGALEAAEIDYVARPLAAGESGPPRLLRPDRRGEPLAGVNAIRAWLRPPVRARGLVCPYCGEAAEVAVDAAGDAQIAKWVEDCPVCCRPWNVTAERVDDGFNVRLERDDD